MENDVSDWEEKEKIRIEFEQRRKAELAKIQAEENARRMREQERERERQQARRQQNNIKTFNAILGGFMQGYSASQGLPSYNPYLGGGSTYTPSTNYGGGGNSRYQLIQQQIQAYKDGISQLDLRHNSHKEQKRLWDIGIQENQRVYNSEYH